MVIVGTRYRRGVTIRGLQPANHPFTRDVVPKIIPTITISIRDNRNPQSEQHSE
jgi:hypothetical protein